MSTGAGDVCKDRQRPEEPLPSDCCGSGCEPCVYDVYLSQLAAWQRSLEEESSLPSVNEREGLLMSRESYRPFTVEGVKHMTAQCMVVHVKATKADCVAVACGGHHIQVRCAIADDEFIVRSFTPVMLNDDLSNCFALLIKVYEIGKMSSALWRNVVSGDILHLRGPWGGFDVKSCKSSMFLLLAAGTGVAPLYQICQGVLDNANDETQLCLLYSVPTADCIFAKEQLDDFSSYWNFNVHYFITQDKSRKGLRYQDSVTHGRIDELHIQKAVTGHDVDTLQVLVCGTDSFVGDMKTGCGRVGIQCHRIFAF